nr:neurobeachin-like isoform X2 [Gorilla gorilla gorilla]XP_055219291.1 neurobeachin-like isoform X2 [Gorilla gorilla gorilla]XP_055219292.1 neurobeachin-like isoform X2 [Gorilla gorilla gorilla]
MISIVHIYNRWRNNEIQCYVNGQLVSYGDMAWHVNTNDSSRVHVTRPVLEQFLSFAKYLGGLSHGAPLLKQLCDHILFINPAIWIHTPAKVQLSLYTCLSAEFIGTATIYTTIRRIGTVLKIMHTLKYYYWVINPADSSGITPKGLGCLKKWLYVQETCPLCHCHLKNSSQLPRLGTEPVLQPHAGAEQNIMFQEGTEPPGQEHTPGTRIQEGSRDNNERIAR